MLHPTSIRTKVFSCLVAPGAALILALPAQARDLSEQIHVVAPEDAKAEAPYKDRKYAPSRKIDLEHLVLDVTPDFEHRTVAGTATLRFKPIAEALAELRLNAVNLNVSTITGTQAVRAFQVTEDALIVTFKDPVPAGREVTLTVAYSAQPKRGMYFRTEQMGYKPGESHLFTQGEANEARYWFPTFDEPNEKFTSEVICHVPAGMKVFSNGRLVDEKTGADGLTAFRWSQEKPHTSYLISLVAGPFKSLEDRAGTVPLAFHVLPSEIEQAQNSFKNTKDALLFFEQETGTPYPWAKYDQICVNDFMFGGMENTSISTLTDTTLFTAASENIRSSDELVAHELAHQWFGDLVTTKDWANIWLNEGFATYYAHLYTGHHDGRDAMLYGLYGSAAGATAASDRKPIVYREFANPMEQFGYRAYPKGAWVLHMLRSQLGEDLYRKVIKTYIERHRYDNVVTDDLRAVVEELSGRSFDQFFDQWVYHGHHPELQVRYSWDEQQGMAKLTVEQTQKLDQDVLLFSFPVTVRFKTAAGGVTDRQIQVSRKAEDFYFALPQAPAIVRFDPQYTVLAKTDFRLPNPMLYAQLRDKSDMMGRLLAIVQLDSQKNQQSDYIALLRKTLQNDAFYGVRVKAARSLREIHNDEALAALTDSLGQSDARVRQAVVQSIGGFYRDEACVALRKVLATERNPSILMSAIEAIAVYPQPEVRELLLQFLRTDSYHNEVADSAIDAMRTQDDPSYIGPIRETIAQRGGSFRSASLGRALDTLAFLGRKQDNKDELRALIAGYTQSERTTLQQMAIGALGTLEDPRALPVLQTFAGAAKDTPGQAAAERAIAQLRAARKPADDLKALRDEVLALTKQGQALKEQVEDLQKKSEAKTKKAAPAPAPAGH